MRLLLCSLMVAAVLATACVAAAGEAYDPHGMRDPFLPLVTGAGAIIMYDAAVTVSEMGLEGIISGGDGRAAIINGNIVEPGARVGLYTVGRIEADSVILLKDGQESVLRLKKEE